MKTRNWPRIALATLFPLFFVATAFAQSTPKLRDGRADLTTPRRAMESFLWWAGDKPGQSRSDLAAESLDSAGMEQIESGPKLAVRLKRWMDAKGIYINTKLVPDTPDYVDATSKEAKYFPSENPDFRKIYLTQSGGIWHFSAETVAAIDGLYEAEFPPLVDFVFNHLPRQFQFEIPVLEVKLWQILGFFALVLVAWAIGRASRWVLDHPLRGLVSKTQTQWDDVIFDAISKPLGLLVIALLLSSTFHLLLFAKLNRPAELIFGGIAAFSLVWAAWRLGEGISNHLKEVASKTETKVDDHLIPVVRIGLRILVVSLGGILILQALGINVGTLVAGLGIGGLAVALAAQNLLGDLFASVTIALDKPFVVGDDIQVGEQVGKVEFVGLKTTRIRSANGEQLIFSNTDLLKNMLRNYKRMGERRSVIVVGVVYQTPAAKLEKIPGMLQSIAEGDKRVRFERSHLKQLGSSSIDYELVFFVNSPGYKDWMDARQDIQLEIVRCFEKEGIAFAYPTQTLFVEKASGA